MKKATAAVTLREKWKKKLVILAELNGIMEECVRATVH